MPHDYKYNIPEYYEVWFMTTRDMDLLSECVHASSERHVHIPSRSLANFDGLVCTNHVLAFVSQASSF